MKILSLNTWGGTMYVPLMEFVARQSKTVDVFCFQEVFRARRTAVGSRFRHSLFGDFSRALPGFRGVFCPTQSGTSLEREGPVDYPLAIGLALFVKKPLSFRTGHAFIHRHRDALLDDCSIRVPNGKRLHDPAVVRQWRGIFADKVLRRLPEALQYAVVKTPAGSCTVAHLKGLWYPGTKHDTPQRIAQSKKIIATLARFPGRKVLCGDFNLLPTTKSIRMIERVPLRNLITEYHIRDTRGPISHALHPDDPQFFADYAFVSPDVRVRSFRVPKVAVSDHLPLIVTVR